MIPPGSPRSASSLAKIPAKLSRHGSGDSSLPLQSIRRSLARPGRTGRSRLCYSHSVTKRNTEMDGAMFVARSKARQQARIKC